MSTPPDLAPQDPRFVDFLAASGLTPDDVPGWALKNKFEVNRLLGAGEHNRIKCDCIAIPYFDLDGIPVEDQGEPFYRVRLLDPEKRVSADGKLSNKKYASPAGAGTFLFIPHGLKGLLAGLSAHDDPPPFVITEGEKKAAALVKIGVPAVGLPGITMGRLRDDPEDKTSPRKLLIAIPKIIEAYLAALRPEQIPRVLVLFDSDGMPGATFEGSQAVSGGHVGNKNVFFEAKGLAAEIGKTLLSRAAIVTAAWCPRGPAGADGKPEKRGVDDWIEAEKRETGSPDAVVHLLSQFCDSLGRADAVTGAARSPGYKVLGVDGLSAVVWDRQTHTMHTLTARELGSAAAIMLALGASTALANWPKFSKDGTISLDVQTAAAELIDEGRRSGQWIESRLRGGGVWLEDDGALRINAHGGFYRATREGLVDAGGDARFAGRHIYPATGRFSIGAAPETLGNGRELSLRLVKHLKSWGWKNETAPYLLAGWLCQQAYLGALNARPHLTLIGESGAGKSVLAEHCGTLLGGTAYRIEDGAGTTPAGIRQTLQHDAMTVLLDEAEPGANQSQVAEQRAATMRRTLDMLRTAYSASDGGNVRTTVKGSASGEAQDYSIRMAAMINAINRPDFDQADRNRFLLLEVVKEGRSTTEPDVAGLDAMGNQIRHLLWRRWDDFQSIYAHIVGMADLGEARLRKTWGGPVAALTALSYGEMWRDNLPAIEELARNLARDQGDAGGDVGESDHERARRTLLSTMLQIEKEEHREHGTSNLHYRLSVHETFEKAKKTNPKTNDNWAGKMLQQYGMSRVEAPDGPMLFVSDCTMLRNALRGTPWGAGQNIVDALARLEGARRTVQRPVDTRVRINGTRQYGVYLPMPDDEPPQSAQQQEEDVRVNF